MKRGLRFLETDFAQLFPERSRHPPEGFRIGVEIRVVISAPEEVESVLRGRKPLPCLLDAFRRKVVPPRPALLRGDDLGKIVEFVAPAAHREGFPEVAEEIVGDRLESGVHSGTPDRSAPIISTRTLYIARMGMISIGSP
ncbi:MAG TPA: hypothetical protein DEH27_10590 [Deltaproteobacteria bacterium]|nr:hypothetical protein [Deltaproteobacteria bacterium]